LQGEAGEGAGGALALQIDGADLRRRLTDYLGDVSVDDILDRLSKIDAILVNYGGKDQFGFVHRSFQEYFAATWMANELDDSEFREHVEAERPGWNETLYLAVAQLRDKTRTGLLLDLLKHGRVEFAVACVRARGSEEDWLLQLVRLLSLGYEDGREYVGLTAAACAEACLARKETGDVLAVLQALFAFDDLARRDGRSLASALELAEALADRAPEAADFCRKFYAEAAQYGLDGTAKMALVNSFLIDRFLVTNHDFECMAPGHRKLRNEYSDADNQPVIRVNWYEAKLFCKWRGAGFRLPTEGEWFLAAAGEPPRTYPWGDKFDTQKCNTHEGGRRKTSPVDDYPAGVSFYGCYGMAGNAWEWLDSVYEEGGEFRVLRGGSWLNSQYDARCSFRNYGHPHSRFINRGFRCARTY
jgi:hypothetical protein